ncbi:MAG: DUF979 domain-containing protein [Eubacteriales bacterium]|nr:DUF979 domain-containing protein [Eubacteriales bacterium]
MEFFMNSDIALSDKLLEILYIVMGLLCIYTGIKNGLDKTNKLKIGTAIFWILLGIVIAFGRWIPSKINGVLIILLVLPAIFKRVGAGKRETISEEKVKYFAEKIGLKLFLPALSIGICAIIFALFTSFSALVGIGFGVIISIILLMIFSKENTPKVFLNEAASTLSILGPLSLMPMLLASLGSIFEKAGVGEVISKIVGGFIPEGNVTIGIIVFAIGMMLFTMIMGNAFAAITVMLVGIAGPFVLKYGANPVIVGMIGLTSGYCGTLLTPMAANFNILPVAMLDMKDRFGVIKNQIIPAFILLIFQIIYMITFS